MSTSWTGLTRRRSTAIHWGSANALDHRVPSDPSVAADAGKCGPSTEDAVVGWPWERIARGIPYTASSATDACPAVYRLTYRAVKPATLPTTTWPGPWGKEYSSVVHVMP